MLWSLKIFLYVCLITILSVFGSLFMGVYIFIEKIFFLLYLSMKIHNLKRDGDVLNLLEKKNSDIKLYLYGVIIVEEIDVLENIYFIDLKLLKKIYLRFIYLKIIIIVSFFTLGICTVIRLHDISNISVTAYIIWILSMLFLIMKLYMNFILLSKVKSEKYIIKTADVNGIDYHAAYIENRKKERVSLLKKVMK